MKTIKFSEDREFDYGRGVVLHKAGDVVAVHRKGDSAIFDGEGVVASIRDDKAQRWLNRGVARADVPEDQKADHDDAVEGSANVDGSDGGDSGQRAVHEPAGGKPGPQGKGGNRRK